MNNIKINRDFVLNILFALILILGVFLRLYYCFENSTFEEDECRLAIAVFDSKNLLLPLMVAQTAPPLFTIATKFLTDIFGTSEYVYRLIPLISSFLSLIFFYKLCNKYLKSKLAVFLGFTIFAVCVHVIYFSYTFKQYSSDSLIAILCLYYLPQIKLKDLSIKKQVILTVTLTLMPLFSLTSLFFIGAYFILNINKKLLYTIIPFSVIMGVYYYFNLHQSSINMNVLYSDYWNNGFLNWNLKNLIPILVMHLKFLFNPNKYILFQIILFLIGSGLALKDKKFYMMLISLGLVFLASLLHLYPISGRTALYTVSIFIILIFNAFSTESKKIYITSVFLFVFGFYNYLAVIPEYRKVLSVKYAPESLLTVIKDNYNTEKDSVIMNEASESSFAFYARKLKFDKFSFNIWENKSDSIQKNHYYWVYLIKDYTLSPVFDEMLEWVKKQKVLFFRKEKESYLIYLKT